MAISTLLNALLSLIAAWLLYTFESPYLGETIQMISQLFEPIGLLLRAVIFLANFVLVFFILSIIFDRLD